PRSGAHGFWHFWRHWYPHLFFLLCFEKMGTLAHLVYPGWHDAKLIAFDTWLTGVNPSLWLERFAHPALNEFMQFAYLTYFLYLLILGGILYYRREWEAYWAVMTYSVVGYAFGYVIGGWVIRAPGAFDRERDPSATAHFADDASGAQFRRYGRCRAEDSRPSQRQ